MIDMKNILNKRVLNKCFWIILGIPVVLFLMLLISVILSLFLFSKPGVVLKNILSEEIRFAITLSLLSSLISTFLCALVALPTAYFVVRKKSFIFQIIDIIIELPVAFPPLVAGVGLLILLGPFLGNYLAMIGLKFVFTFNGIIISQFFVAVPFAIKMMKATFQEIDVRYEIVGRTLMAYPFQTFFRITLPLAKKGIIGMLSLTWARILGEFGATMMLVGATRFKTETLPNALFLNMTDGNLDMVIATSLVFVFIGGFVLFIYKMMTLRFTR
ncbi:MAG: ABC transporter permease subunit [Spirochaetales bacterium]|nr:ABC transporter permease subunit [Spirochaetales bacterium]